jgi:hypothetical protein
MAYRFKTPGLVVALARRIGRRGYFLLTLALVDFAYGRTFVWPADPGARVVNGYLTELVPFAADGAAAWVWMMAWWVVGAFCLVNAFRREDRWGYGMAVGIKIIYVGALTVAASEGMPNGTTRALVWMFIASAVFLISTWPEARRDIQDVAAEMERTGELPRVREEGGEDA